MAPSRFLLLGSLLLLTGCDSVDGTPVRRAFITQITIESLNSVGREWDPGEGDPGEAADVYAALVLDRASYVLVASNIDNPVPDVRRRDLPVVIDLGESSGAEPFMIRGGDRNYYIELFDRDPERDIDGLPPGMYDDYITETDWLSLEGLVELGKPEELRHDNGGGTVLTIKLRYES